MATQQTPTHEIPRRIWSAYFDGLSRMYQGWRVSVEVLSLDLGDQPIVENGRLWGLSFERKGSAANSILIETGDPNEGVEEHWAFEPVSVREANTQPGSEADVQVECADGSVTIIRIQRRPELPPGAGLESGFESRGRRPAYFRTRAERFQRRGRAGEYGRSPWRVRDEVRSSLRGEMGTEPRGGGSVLWMLAAAGAGLWLLNRMRGGRRRAKWRVVRVYERPWRVRPWTIRS